MLTERRTLCMQQTMLVDTRRRRILRFRLLHHLADLVSAVVAQSLAAGPCTVMAATIKNPFSFGGLPPIVSAVHK